MDGHDLCFYTACELCSPPDIVTFVEISTSISLVVTRIRTIRENTKNFTVSLLTMSDQKKASKKVLQIIPQCIDITIHGLRWWSTDCQLFVDDDLQIVNFDRGIGYGMKSSRFYCARFRRNSSERCGVVDAPCGFWLLRTTYSQSTTCARKFVST